MKKFCSLFLSLAMVFMPINGMASSGVRLKDITTFEGVRENMLLGYGLVVGLNGTGDKIKNNKFTEESLISFLERLGVTTRGFDLKSRNVAAVTVTASMPGFARNGSRMDVSVSAIGDAKSLQGGVLLATPLYGADGQVYAVAQGALAIGGFSAGGESKTVVKGVPTSGFISNGAVIEKETGFELNSMKSINISLRNPDFATAQQIASVINGHIGEPVSLVMDPSTVKLSVPPNFSGSMANMLTDIEQLQVNTDQSAKIVIDETSGTVVIGENVKIDTVAIAQGNLVVSVEENAQVSQPGAFAPDGAQTATVNRTDVNVNEGKGQVAILKEAPNLKSLVDGLNALGVSPRDLITILQTIKSAGSLQAEIESR